MDEKFGSKEDRVGALMNLVENLSDDQILDLAAKKAAPHNPKSILTPSEGQGQARSKVPEELAHLIARLYQGERSLRKEGRKGMTDGNYRQLESFCQQNSTTVVPFDILAGLPDSGKPPADTLRQAGHWLAESGEKVKTASLLGPDGAPAIMLALGEIVFEAQRILNLFGWTFDDVKLNVRREMDIRNKKN